MSSLQLKDLRTSVTDWQSDHKRLMQVRITVFVEEQAVPLEIEQDDYDLTAQHFLSCLPDGSPIATARLVNAEKIGRMAVLKEYRGLGVGAYLLSNIIEFARQENIPVLKLNAQLTAKPFYEKLGFSVEGDTFMEANIEHIAMTLSLR